MDNLPECYTREKPTEPGLYTATALSKNGDVWVERLIVTYRFVEREPGMPLCAIDSTERVTPVSRFHKEWLWYRHQDAPPVPAEVLREMGEGK